jgi:hypothetical protein
MSPLPVRKGETMETMMNQNDRNATPQDRQTEEWLVGFRIGLVLAEQGMSEIMRQGGRTDVLDDEGLKAKGAN